MATTKGPGEFFSVDTLRSVMTEQKRPRIGGARLYGDEWDDYFIPRGWKARQPMLNADVKEAARNVVMRALKRGIPIEDQKNVLRAKERPRVRTHPRMKMWPKLKRRKKSRGVKTTLEMSDLGSLGADYKPSDEVDLITAVREIYDSVVPLKGFLATVGENPYGTIALFMLSVGVGAYLGGFVGSRGIDVLKKKFGF